MIMGREERGLEWRNKKIIVATAHQLVIFAHVAASRKRGWGEENFSKSDSLWFNCSEQL